jgi:hypothetical protein
MRRMVFTLEVGRGCLFAFLCFTSGYLLRLCFFSGWVWLLDLGSDNDTSLPWRWYTTIDTQTNIFASSYTSPSPLVLSRLNSHHITKHIPQRSRYFGCRGGIPNRKFGPFFIIRSCHAYPKFYKDSLNTHQKNPNHVGKDGKEKRRTLSFLRARAHTGIDSGSKEKRKKLLS